MSMPVTSVALIDGIDVDAVAAAVTACPGVSGLFGGRGDAIASYLPGRRVAGVEVNPAAVTIHVRSKWGIPAPQLLTQIATAVSPLLRGRHLEVVVADIDDADPPAPQEAIAPQSPAVPELPAVPVPPKTTAVAPPPVPTAPIVDPTAIDSSPGAVPRTVVRPPGSAPMPSAPSPKPAPPTFPTA